ncbi:ImmA/IrrE family metallo-endopeptidase [Vibrio mediterranei]|uniref:ImmA/IrrE family metallo-endopeptidase n=1 Tax=Vibrio mediterranei TaxID=689 RepID=UPI0022852035|nr:ImmA/IrrE family metallo-endopeptidase [Vibrio mediterranei]MCY9855804.1 ImmA/IrrE family metallo-endopeptidase [Vibrio mediterranei]
MEQYQLRGNRVEPMRLAEIASRASHIGNYFGFTRRKKKQLDIAFEKLSEFGITLNVVPDEEWLNLTKGHFDPSTLTISIPQNIYLNACMGEQEALGVMLHELGHLFLGHRALLHHTSVLPTIEEDAEWQADSFADVILKRMGYQTAQLSFDFYM